MRAFIALEIPQEVKDYLQVLIKNMSSKTEGVKWIKNEGLHVTLKFFEEIEEEKAKTMWNTLVYLESKYSPIEVTISSIGAFPDKKRARVIVIMFQKGVDIIKSIFNDIEGSLFTLGIEKEARQFTPHVTLGRRRIPAPLLERDIEGFEEKNFVLQKLMLFKSTLTGGGAIYTPQWEIIIGGSHGKRGQ
jgi:2'-5' RNA ligase